MRRGGAARSSRSPAQRTAIKQRPHQQTKRWQVATSEPVVHDHGREGGGAGGDEVRPTVSYAEAGRVAPRPGAGPDAVDQSHHGRPEGVLSAGIGEVSEIPCKGLQQSYAGSLPGK